MVEHAETFLSLFAVDMDAALEVQPPDTWDSFPLFQLINDSLRSDCMYFVFWLCPFQWAAQVTDNASSLSLLHRELRWVEICRFTNFFSISLILFRCHKKKAHPLNHRSQSGKLNFYFASSSQISWQWLPDK